MADQTDDPQPYAADADDSSLLAETTAEERRGNVVLAVLAALLVALLGVAAWGAIFAYLRPYVGIAVVIGFAVGYVLREVSKRSTIAIRVLAVVITALACVLGTVVGDAATVAHQYDLGFWVVFKDIADNALDLVGNREPITLAIYGAALVVAFLSAAPKKEKPVASEPVRTEDGEPPAMDLSRS